MERGTYSKPTTAPQPLACPAETLRRIVAAGATEHPSRPDAAPNLVAVRTSSGVEVLQLDAEARVIDRWVDPTEAPEASAPGDEGSISERVISVEKDAYVITVTTSLWQPSQMCRVDQPITFRVGLKRGVIQALQRRVGREVRQCGE